ncbi:hypothetical protein PINS_up022090 [Pythium insidiosum]|nr:hypothetical protein PINS_up022090 [Pythium insidiosum]
MQAARERFVVGASDVLTDVHAFLRWRRVVAVAPRDESTFCRDHFLSRRALHEIRKLATHLRSLVVSQLGFKYGDDKKQKEYVELTPASLALSSALLAGRDGAQCHGRRRVGVRRPRDSRCGTRNASWRSCIRRRSTAATRARAAQLSATRAVSPCYAFAVKLHTSQVFVPTSSLVLRPRCVSLARRSTSCSRGSARSAT